MLDMADVPSEVQRKIVVSCDNASNITKAVTDSSMLHIRCLAHTLNLAVQKFVSVIEDQLVRVRAIVKFFHNSPGATRSLKVSFCVIHSLSNFVLNFTCLSEDYYIIEKQTFLLNYVLLYFTIKMNTQI